ncbi:MAG: hypothetical protein ACTSXX_09005, partial [Candidatus Baldrarchaeia archaeon]
AMLLKNMKINSLDEKCIITLSYASQQFLLVSPHQEITQKLGEKEKIAKLEIHFPILRMSPETTPFFLAYIFLKTLTRNISGKISIIESNSSAVININELMDALVSLPTGIIVPPPTVNDRTTLKQEISAFLENSTFEYYSFEKPIILPKEKIPNLKIIIMSYDCFIEPPFEENSKKREMRTALSRLTYGAERKYLSLSERDIKLLKGEFTQKLIDLAKIVEKQAPETSKNIIKNLLDQLPPPKKETPKKCDQKNDMEVLVLSELLNILSHLAPQKLLQALVNFI